MSREVDVLAAKVRELAREFDASFATELTVDSDRSVQDFLVVSVSDVAYALRLAQVRGLIAKPHITRVPSPSPALLGVAGVRGAIVPVLSLSVLLGHAHSTPPAWMVLAGAREAVGLAFERYEALLRAGPDDVASLSGEERGRARLREVVRAGEQRLPIVDLPGLIEAIVKENRDLGSRSGPLKTE